METLRVLVSIPLMVAEAIYARLTRNSEEAFIRDQTAKFQRWANDQ